jgi:hypothetical protein
MPSTTTLPTGAGPSTLPTSRSQTAGSLGFGWTHSYEMRIEPVQDEQEFVYLPSSLTSFSQQDRVEGPRSDTLDTRNVGSTLSTEKIDWADYWMNQHMPAMEKRVLPWMEDRYKKELQPLKAHHTLATLVETGSYELVDHKLVGKSEDSRLS